MDSNIFADCWSVDYYRKTHSFPSSSFMLCIRFYFPKAETIQFSSVTPSQDRTTVTNSKMKQILYPITIQHSALDEIVEVGPNFVVLLYDRTARRQDIKWSKLLSLCYYCSKGFPGTASSNSAMSVHSAVSANTQRSTDKGGSNYEMFVLLKLQPMILLHCKS